MQIKFSDYHYKRFLIWNVTHKCLLVYVYSKSIYTYTSKRNTYLHVNNI